MISDNAKIGTGLLALGIVFLFLGMLFLFDSAMLALGDILFLLGLTLTIGRYNQSDSTSYSPRGKKAFSSQFHLLLCRTKPNIALLFSKGPSSWYHFLLWWCSPGYDSMAHYWNDVSTVWISLFVWSILSDCSSVHARYAHHWRYIANAGYCQLFRKLWRRKFEKSASLDDRDKLCGMYVQDTTPLRMSLWKCQIAKIQEVFSDWSNW